VRTVSSASISLDVTGKYICFLPAGAGNALEVYNTDSGDARVFELPNRLSDVRACAITRDGTKVAFIADEMTQGEPLSDRWFHRERVGVADVNTGEFRYLNAYANHYGGGLEFDVDGKFLFYRRSLDDSGNLSTPRKSLYTHRFFCCTSGAYIARYDLTADHEDIAGPVMAPQGDMLIGIQVTARNVFFYAYGLTRAMQFDYDEDAPRENKRAREKQLSAEYQDLYLHPHPTEVEIFKTESTDFLGEHLYTLPLEKVTATIPVHTVQPQDWGFDSLKIDNFWRIRPGISDDERAFYWASDDGICYGQLSSAGLRCFSLGREALRGTLSHDGSRIVFMDQELLWEHVKGRICVLSMPGDYRKCKWRPVRKASDITAVPLKPAA